MAFAAAAAAAAAVGTAMAAATIQDNGILPEEMALERESGRDVGIMLSANRGAQMVNDLYIPQVLRLGTDNVNEAIDVYAEDQANYAAAQANYAFRGRETIFRDGSFTRLPLIGLINPNQRLFGELSKVNVDPRTVVDNPDGAPSAFARISRDRSGVPHRTTQPHNKGPGKLRSGKLPTSIQDRNQWAITSQGYKVTHAREEILNIPRMPIASKGAYSRMPPQGRYTAYQDVV